MGIESYLHPVINSLAVGGKQTDAMLRDAGFPLGLRISPAGLRTMLSCLLGLPQLLQDA